MLAPRSYIPQGLLGPRATPVVFNEQSLSRLADVNPQLRALMLATEAEAARRGVNLEVSEGMRTADRQAQLVAQGASQTMNSRHLTGNAVDLHIVGPDGAPNWDFEAYRPIADIARATAANMGINDFVWGGDWQSLRDGVHFQIGGPSQAAPTQMASNGDRLSTSGGSDTMTGGAGGDRMAGLLAPQEPARRPSIWDRLEGVPILGGLADPDRRARLAVGLGGMSLNPNATLMATNLQGIQDRQQERETAQRLNQTIAYLESIGRGDLAALAAIDPGAALGQSQGPSELEQAQLERIRLETEMMRNGGADVPADVASLQWRAQQMGLVEGTPEYTAFIASNGEMPATPSTLEPEAVTELRKTWEALPAVRAFQTQAAGFSRLDAAAAQGNSTGDMALIFSFMKLLDPASTVREGEAAQASQAPGVQNSIIAEYNRAINGQVLSPERRAEILATARATYGAAEQGYQQLYDQYAALASGQGFDPTTTLTDYRYTARPVEPTAETDGSFTPAVTSPATTPGPNNAPSPVVQSAPPSFASNQTIQAKAQELGITVDQMWAYVPEDQRAQWLN